MNKAILKYSLFSLLVVFFCAARSWAGAELKSGKNFLSLKQAIALALEYNPGLLATFSGVKVAGYGVSKAKSRFLPRLDLISSYSYSNNPVYVFGSKLEQEVFASQDFKLDRLNTPDPLGNWKSGFYLTQSLFNQGQNWSGLKLSKLQLKLAEQSREQRKQRVILEVEQGFLHWLLAQERFAVLDHAVKTAQANLQVIESRYDSGTALKSDLLQTRVHLARLQKERLAMKNQIALAMSKLNLVMGQSIEQQWSPVFPKFAAPVQPGPLTIWLARAKKQRPEVRWYRIRQEMAKVMVQKSKLAFLPALNLKGGYERDARTWSGPAGDNFIVQAELAFNLYAGQGEEKSLRQAEAAAKEIAFLARENGQHIVHQVRSAWLDLQTAKQQLLVTAQSVAQSEEGLRIVQKRYANGLTIITELLSAQTALKQARLDHLEARYAYQLDLARLYWAAGVLDKDFPLLANGASCLEQAGQ